MIQYNIKGLPHVSKKVFLKFLGKLVTGPICMSTLGKKWASGSLGIGYQHQS